MPALRRPPTHCVPAAPMEQRALDALISFRDAIDNAHNGNINATTEAQSIHGTP